MFKSANYLYPFVNDVNVNVLKVQEITRLLSKLP